ncbi:metallophosphoesterase family protein [Maioricimonas sp. JC845]|uniref:metallophosphoesterase family protein n=1 Tax=Maioricimonas sp. JC845 TaxID=3232138 RepID=UPI00345B0DDE
MFLPLSGRFCHTVLLATLTLGLHTVHAHDGHDHEHEAPRRVADEVIHKPTARPDRIVLSWTGNPATSQSVTWRTDTSVTKAFGEIAVAGDGPKFVSKARTVDATSTDFKSDLGPARYHSVTFDNLKPSTKYAYRVGDGVNWSPWMHFTTASTEPKPFTFVYFGDAQNSLYEHWTRVVREAYADAPRAAFFLHAGDLINRADSDAEWGEWFQAGSHIHTTIPCIATPGNHEYAKRIEIKPDGIRRVLTGHWRPTFTFPENGPESLEETAYWIDYQGVRIIALNSNEQIGVQKEWLANVLADNPNRWTIVTFHHPIYSSKQGRDNPGIRAEWKPLFDKYKVDMVLQGHDHTYARSRLISEKNLPTGVAARSDEGGTIYVVSVSGPKMYDLGRHPFMRRAAEDTQLYQIITIDGDKLLYEARTATGRLYDAFTLTKNAEGINRLEEQIPDTPERRREEKPE